MCKCMSSFGLSTWSPSQRLREGLGIRVWKRPGKLKTGLGGFGQTMVDYKRNISSRRSLALNHLSGNRTRQLSEPVTLGSLETRPEFGMIQRCR